MATRLMYLEDFDVLTTTAKVAGVCVTEDGRTDIQLDQTCFYPRGGGQDWDEGYLIGQEDMTEFAVGEVRLDEQGIVHHIGMYDEGDSNFMVGDEVKGNVDKERRIVNTKLHSAGHVVDMAVDRIGLTWVPDKGGHYPHMSFVEYSADITAEQAEELRAKIEATANEIVNAGSENQICFMPVSEMHTVCRHVPENIPTNKPARVVLYAPNFGIPCGGTHVKNVHDIGKIAITKIKSKQGVTKVSYTVEGINQ